MSFKREPKLVLISSRTQVYESADIMGLRFVEIYALEGSYLYNLLKAENISFVSFKESDKNTVIEELLTLDFDILISHGCPVIFPVERFKKEQILLNTHPTVLPYLKGKNPLNGLFYDSHSYYGATIHFIDKGIDTGRILFQEKHKITKDLDLGLLYYLSLNLEGKVFEKGWRILEKSGFKYKGEKQIGKGSYFRRTLESRSIGWDKHDSETILRKVKSFGIKSQGVFMFINKKKYRVFEADRITHPELVKEASALKAGEAFLAYDGKLLVKTKDGLIRLKSYELVN